MRRHLFLRYAGMALGGMVIGPVLSGCGGSGEASLLPVDRNALVADPSAISVSAVAEDLSAEEIAGLKYMREEEKLAHDVYVALGGLWGNRVFSQIALSEIEHTEAVRRLIEAHGLEDPAAGNPPGVFVNAELQAMYDNLVARGQASLIDALKVGCLIEEKDIQDINEKIAQVDGEFDLVQVYANLLCGSRNHLRAFNSNLLNQGERYVPVVIAQPEWDAIANSPMETCGG